MLRLPSFLCRGRLTLGLIRMISSILLNTSRTINQRLRLTARFRRSTIRFLINDLLRGPPFLIRSRIFNNVGRLLSIGPLLIRIFRFNGLCLMDQFILRHVISTTLRIRSITSNNAYGLLRNGLSITRVTLLTQDGLFLLMMIRRFIRRNGILISSNHISFLIHFRRRFRGIRRTNVRFRRITILTSSFFLCRRFRPIFVILRRYRYIKVTRARHLSFLRRFHRRSPNHHGNVSGFIGQSRCVRDLIRGSNGIVVYPPVFLVFQDSFPPLTRYFSKEGRRIPMLPYRCFDAS